MITSFTQDLKASLPESSWTRVLRSLRQEPLVWNALKDKSFSQAALEFGKGNPELLSPACLSMLALGKADLCSRLRENVTLKPDDALSSRVSAAYKSFTSTPIGEQEPLTLSDAGLLALALHQRYQSAIEVDQLFDEFSELPLNALKPVIACFFGMLAQPEDWALAIINHQAEVSNPLLVHAILANPLTLEQMASIMYLSLIHI